MGVICLFAFPSAGSSKVMYKGFEKYLNDQIDFIPLEFAGRGERVKDDFFKNMDEVIEDLLPRIEYKSKNMPFAFLGHSLGALIAYYLALKLQDNNLTSPRHLFLSGRKNPVVSKKESLYHKLRPYEMKDLLLKLGGTPKELLDDDNFLGFILPIIKADFQLLSQFNISYFKKKKLNCDITVLNGEDDNLIKEKIDWNYATNSTCDYFLFNGGHFFINDFKKEIADIIKSKIL
ncbi:thioesterase [Virgibacillus sp. NKC19-3]|uniref:thioesterase II family protein n=1 Tax=Virgibacillus saliphilus TaxID=2831674 RepID=UPI001C9A6A36|nr:thioesterase domain-containing protein [Virgibacillus sp. NKC19-3]MBY7142452.1 thioesterase [Virgibacillus sp. NKC19-3]